MWLIYTLTRDGKNKPYHVGVIGPNDNGNDIDETYVTMHIYGTTRTAEEAAQHQNELIERYGIKSNAAPVAPSVNKQPPVLCETTGMTYPSIRAACRANDIDKGRLSLHLRNRKAVPAVKGLTFKRIYNV